MTGPKCHRCGETLRPRFETVQVREESNNALGGKDFATVTKKTGRILGYGFKGHNVFCSQSCGYLWALSVVREIDERRSAGRALDGLDQAARADAGASE